MPNKNIYLNDIPVDLFLEYFDETSVDSIGLVPSIREVTRKSYTYNINITIGGEEKDFSFDSPLTEFGVAEVEFFFYKEIFSYYFEKETQITEEDGVFYRNLHFSDKDENKALVKVSIPEISSVSSESKLVFNAYYSEKALINQFSQFSFFRKASNIKASLIDLKNEETFEKKNSFPSADIVIDGSIVSEEELLEKIESSENKRIEISLENSASNELIENLFLEVQEKPINKEYPEYIIFLSDGLTELGKIVSLANEIADERTEKGQNVYIDRDGNKVVFSSFPTNFKRHNLAFRKSFFNLFESGSDSYIFRFEPGLIGMIRKGSEDEFFFYEKYSNLIDYRKIDISSDLPETPIFREELEVEPEKDIYYKKNNGIYEEVQSEMLEEGITYYVINEIFRNTDFVVVENNGDEKKSGIYKMDKRTGTWILEENIFNYSYVDDEKEYHYSKAPVISDGYFHNINLENSQPSIIYLDDIKIPVKVFGKSDFRPISIYDENTEEKFQVKNNKYSLVEGSKVEISVYDRQAFVTGIPEPFRISNTDQISIYYKIFNSGTNDPKITSEAKVLLISDPENNPFVTLSLGEISDSLKGKKLVIGNGKKIVEYEIKEESSSLYCVMENEQNFIFSENNEWKLKFYFSIREGLNPERKYGRIKTLESINEKSLTQLVSFGKINASSDEIKRKSPRDLLSNIKLDVFKDEEKISSFFTTEIFRDFRDQSRFIQKRTILKYLTEKKSNDDLNFIFDYKTKTGISLAQSETLYYSINDASNRGMVSTGFTLSQMTVPEEITEENNDYFLTFKRFENRIETIVGIEKNNPFLDAPESYSSIVGKFNVAYHYIEDGFFDSRGSLISEGVYDNEKKETIKTLSKVYLNNNSSDFLDIMSAYDQNGYLKMRIFSEGLYNMISSDNLELKNVKLKGNFLDLNKSSNRLILEKRSKDLSARILETPSVSDFEVLSKDSSSSGFSRLLKYKQFPTNKLREKNSREILKRKKIYNSSEFTEKAIFESSFERAKLRHNQLKRIDFKPLIINLLEGYFFQYNLPKAEISEYINAYNNYIEEKMDKISPNYEQGSSRSEEVSYKKVFEFQSMNDDNYKEIFDSVFNLGSEWRIL